MEISNIRGFGLAAALVCAAAAGIAGAEGPPVVPADQLTMDTLVVSPSRTEQPISETAAAITVVTGEELRRKQVPTVADALREVPGVTVVESGSRGSNLQVLLRGSASDQVLVLVDGVRVNSTTLGSFDFSSLTPENIDRVEVLRGFGGTLYGSEAIGGVIQIFTRKGEGPPRGSVLASGGNAGTDREVAEVSGQSGIFSFSGSASHFRTDGFKAENDDYENTVVSGRLDAQVIDEGSARVFFRVGDADFGNFLSNNFLAAPDPNARQKNQTDYARGEWSQQLASALRFRLGGSYARDDTDFVDPPDAAETSSLDSDVLSQRFTGDGQGTVDWLEGVGESIVGFEYEIQSADVDSVSSDPTFGDFATRFDRDIRNVAGYALQQLFLDERRLVVSGGVRVDDNQRFGQAVSPSGGVTYTVAASGTRLRATYAKGFKAPTLNQLFFPGFGNPDLDAERSWEVSGGFDQPFAADRALFSASVFHRKVRSLIEAVPQPDTGLFLAENVGRATVDGFESALEADLFAGLRAGGQYTWLDVDASVNGRVRRPRHQGSLHVGFDGTPGWTAGDRVTADVRLLLVGSRLDFDPAAGFAAVRNPGYHRVDVALAYGVAVGTWPLQRLSVFFRIENLFDAHYQEVRGFGARPTNVIAGIKGEF